MGSWFRAMDVAYGVESRKQAIRILDNQKLTLITQYDELTQDATEHRSKHPNLGWFWML